MISENNKFVFVFFFLAIVNSLFPQKNTVLDNNKIDNEIFLFSKRESLNIDSVVNFVNQTFTKEEDKVRAYFSYISLNISYDLNRLTELKLYSASSFQNHLKASLSESPELVFNRKKAVCEGYSNLMQYFCKKSNITCHLIIGYVKLDDEVKTDILHEWNSVKIDSTWYLLDITWSNGYINQNNQFVKQFSELYYLKSNEYFIKDHLPLDPIWQLCEMPRSKSFFFKGDTINKYYSTNFNFKDSITDFLSLNKEDMEVKELCNFVEFDPDNEHFKNNLDVLLLNRAIDNYNVATILYEDFVTYYNTKLIKNQTKKGYAKAIEILENSKLKAEKSLNLILNHELKTTTLNTKKQELTKNINNLKSEINKAKVTLTKQSKLIK